MTIRKRGETWQAIVRVTQDGTKFEETRTFKTERLAKDWKARMLAEIKVKGIPQRTLSTMTLGKLILDYMDAVNSVKPMRRQMVWEMHQLAGEFKNVKLNQITAKTFTDFGRRRVNEGTAGGATILHNLSTIRSVLSGAKPVLGVDVNGATVVAAIDALSRIGAVNRSVSRIRRPTGAELLALHAEFERISHHPCTEIPMATFIRLAVAFPRRRGELTDMRWVDYTGGQVTLRDTKHPTKPRDEIVPIPPEARTIIDALPRIDERILPYNPESISAAFQRACNRLGITDLHLHDLRHEGISRLFGQGLGIPEVAMISGHQSWAMLRRYTQLTPESVVQKLAANRVSQTERKDDL